ncbi:hypothetical protein GBF38_022812, partial [Nibea albiflora]
DYSCQENSTCDGPYYDIGATGTCAEEGGGRKGAEEEEEEEEEEEGAETKQHH